MGLSRLADLPARMLSAGQKRRLAIARLAMAPAPLWLLDEPTLGLDAASVARFGALLAAHRGARRDGGGGDPPAAAAAGRGRIAATELRRSPDAHLLAILPRDLRLSFRHGSDTLAALLFFLIAAALFPLAIGPAPETLGRIAPGIVWVCALLAALLPLDRLFGADLEDGSLDCCCSPACRPSAVAAAKAAAHWLVTGVPLLLAAGPLAVMLRMPDDGIPVLLLGLLPGTAGAVPARHRRRRPGARRAPRRRAAAAAGAAAADAGADLRRRGGRCRGGWLLAPAASAAAGGLLARAAALPARRRGRPAQRRRIAVCHAAATVVADTQV